MSKRQKNELEGPLTVLPRLLFQSVSIYLEDMVVSFQTDVSAFFSACSEKVKRAR